MDFLYRERGAGKRTVKPSKDSEMLEHLIGEESDDSDFEVEKHGDGDESDVSGDEEEESDNNGSQSGDSDNEEEEEESDEETDEDEKDDLMQLKKNLTTAELLTIARSQRLRGENDAGGRKDIKVCGACLATRSDDTDEIVSCDSCGISVHEACYGIQESGSVSSTVSDASTEPWFCEPCRANVTDPTCQVCPNVGGIYKETDVGTWIHLVCALYTPNISFFDPERITRATLFELNYQSWGRRACILCRESKYARTGICIGCDAGMCKQYFHASCAQEHGLLSEPKEDDQESYFGHCRMHSDKETCKKRKQNYLVHLRQYKERRAIIQASFTQAAGSDKASAETARILRKLAHRRAQWAAAAQQQSEPWIPTQKMARSLLTSSSALDKLSRKIDLQGWNGRAMEEEERNKEILSDIHKKWWVPPACNVEFIAYYHDRNQRITVQQESLSAIILANNELSDEQALLSTQYNEAIKEQEAARQVNAELRQKIANYRDLLQLLDPFKRSLPDAVDPQQKKQQRATATPAASATRRTAVGTKKSSAASRRRSSTSTPDLRSPTPSRGGRSSTSSSVIQPQSAAITAATSTVIELRSCQLCGRTDDQHLLAHCDVCRLHYHLGCLTPPLTRMPKKTKQYGWQCSDCDKDPSEPFQTPKDAVVDLSAPRSTRNKRPNFAHLNDSDVEVVSPPQMVPYRRAGTTAAVASQPDPVVVPPIKKNSLEQTASQSVVETSTPARRKRANSESTLSESSSEKLPSNKRMKGGKNGAESTSLRRSTERRGTRSDSLTNGMVSHQFTEPLDSVFDSGKEHLSNGVDSPAAKLPPKKLFKSKAATCLGEEDKEEDHPSPAPSFKDWLGMKLSPEKSINQGHASGLSNGYDKDLSDEVSSDVNAETRPSVIRVRLDSRGKAAKPAGDETDSARQAARLERKRMKREEKEKRRQEKRKMRALIALNVTDDDPDIEEDDDTCIVRIAPKPIKIKIKPLAPPVADPSTNPADPSTLSALSTTGGASTALPVSSSSSTPTSQYMHPKKKMVHMDYLTNNDHHRQGVPNGPSASASRESVTRQSALETPCGGSLDAAAPEATPTRARRESGQDRSMSTRPMRERNGIGAGLGSARKGGSDVRTKCDVCLGEGSNANLVRCDECGKCYHFSCLVPPVKKTPKVQGWSWACSDCAPSDEDKSWHL